jgi:hypothetical protein
MRILVAAATLLCLTASCASSFRCPAPFPVTVPVTFHWDCPAVQKPVLAAATNTSVTSQANGNLSVIFDKMAVDLQQQTAALTGSAAGFLTFPITTNATQPTSVNCQVRGFVGKDEAASANVFIDLGGHAVLAEFAAGTAASDDFIKSVSMKIPPAQPQTWGLTVVVTATRPDAKTSVRITVDDVTCALATP